MTPGNHSKNWSIDAPSFRLSNRALMGRRVSVKTQAPLTFSRSLNCVAGVPFSHFTYLFPLPGGLWFKSGLHGLSCLNTRRNNNGKPNSTRSGFLSKGSNGVEGLLNHLPSR